MIKLHLFGSIRHMKAIGDDPSHKALRYRNEQRLAVLKASNRLYEDKSEPVASGDRAAPSSAIVNAEYQSSLNSYYVGSLGIGNCNPGSPLGLGSMLGFDFFNNR